MKPETTLLSNPFSSHLSIRTYLPVKGTRAGGARHQTCFFVPRKTTNATQLDVRINTVLAMPRDIVTQSLDPTNLSSSLCKSAASDIQKEVFFTGGYLVGVAEAFTKVECAGTTRAANQVSSVAAAPAKVVRGRGPHLEWSADLPCSAQRTGKDIPW